MAARTAGDHGVVVATPVEGRDEGYDPRPSRQEDFREEAFSEHHLKEAQAALAAKTEKLTTTEQSEEHLRSRVAELEAEKVAAEQWLLRELESKKQTILQIEEQVQKLESDKQTLERNVRELEREAGESTETSLARLREQEAREREVVDVLGGQLAAAEKKLQQMGEEKRETEAEVQRLRDQQAIRAEAELQKEAAERKTKKLTGTVAVLEAEQARLEAEQARLGAEKARLEVSLEAAEEELQQMRAEWEVGKRRHAADLEQERLVHAEEMLHARTAEATAREEAAAASDRAKSAEDRAVAAEDHAKIADDRMEEALSDAVASEHRMAEARATAAEQASATQHAAAAAHAGATEDSLPRGPVDEELRLENEELRHARDRDKEVSEKKIRDLQLLLKAEQQAARSKEDSNSALHERKASASSSSSTSEVEVSHLRQELKQMTEACVLLQEDVRLKTEMLRENASRDSTNNDPRASDHQTSLSISPHKSAPLERLGAWFSSGGTTRASGELLELRRVIDTMTADNERLRNDLQAMGEELRKRM